MERWQVEFAGVMTLALVRRWQQYQSVVGAECVNLRGFYIWDGEMHQLVRAQPRLLPWWICVPLIFAGMWASGNPWVPWLGWVILLSGLVCLKHHRPPAAALEAVNTRARERDARYAAARYGQ